MVASDALIVGEDWISEHYFTTDAKSQSFQAKVMERRKQWDAAAKAFKEGTQGSQAETVRSRFSAVRGNLSTDYASLLAAADSGSDTTAKLCDLYERLRRILGYQTGEYTIKRDGPVIRVSTPDLAEAAPLVIVEAKAVETVEDVIAKDGDTLLTPYVVDEKETIHSAARLLSTLYVGDGGPEFALVLAGRWLLVTEQARWAEGRYLAVDLQLVCDRKDDKRGGEIDRALACVSAESLAPDAEGKIWWHGVFENSIHHTEAVTEGLREGIRLSIEIIANDVVRRRKDKHLDPLPKDQAQPLARQALRYLYRILFLLYAEASPELEVLPVGAEEYDQGYGLDRLRELILVELTGPHAINGTHIYESLKKLFTLVDEGYPRPEDRGENWDGLVFNNLSADLFQPAATALIDETMLGNAALQRVLRHLLLTDEVKGKDRGFISYATLGINQLGAVYEGLMSYSGFFAEEDLHEVAKDGDPDKGSWVLPVTRSHGIAEDDFVKVHDEVTGEPKPVIHERGMFVFRLAGRERQQSASYYTPEVLTKFTVSQALEELLDQDGQTTPAEKILDLTVCEPALGSGAFAIEAVRQLAEQYLRRRQRELGKKIEPDDYQRELQRVKAYIALHQVYGVDLNATAVEFAEITLWLDTMAAGLQAPWFGLRLRRGNSLIGVRRAVYKRAQVTDKGKTWLTAVPTDVPMTGMVEEMKQGATARQSDGRIHHFLLPTKGWGSAVVAKEAKEVIALVPDEVAALRKWRSSITSKPSAKQVGLLVELAYRVEALWQITLRRLQIAESEARRDIKLWERDDPGHTQAVTREQIENILNEPNGSYRRLRRVMDAWCALWFWPITDTKGVQPPTLDQWIDACQQLLGRAPEARKKDVGQATLGDSDDWEELNQAEEFNFNFAMVVDVEKVMEAHPWLTVCAEIAKRQGFFHWELDFATVFVRGGFDLQLGNPPWVKVQTDVAALLAEGDPWWQLALKPDEEDKAARRESTLALPGMRDFVIDNTADVSVTMEYLGSAQVYPLLDGLQPDLYRCFMEQSWNHASSNGMVALIHLESHFTDENAGFFRELTYRRLRRHWQFINELKLYEIQDQKRYGINVYGNPGEVDFLTATSLYHPDTVGRSLRHDGSGEEPGIKDLDGNWDLRPHRARITRVAEATLGAWHAITEGDATPVGRTRMVYTVNSSAAEVLEVLSCRPRVGALDFQYSEGWHESRDRRKGYFVSRWGVPQSRDDVILQGPHLYVDNPYYKSPNRSMKNPQDWSGVDFENLAEDAVPVTGYKPSGIRSKYESDYTVWDGIPARACYRIAWRRMAANTGERTLIPAIIPPGTAHVNTISSVGLPGEGSESLCVASGFLASIIADFSIRAVPKNDIRLPAINRLPLLLRHPLQNALVTRTLRLNCVMSSYSDLWRDVYSDEFTEDIWVSGRERENRALLGEVGLEWTAATPLRIAEDRRQALVEIDSLVALMLGVTADQLCTIYRTQFPVLYGYDHNSYVYDINGRLVPNEVLSVWRKKKDAITEAERTATNQAGNTYTYELPFTLLDREKDMREAYAEFERHLVEM